MSFIYFYFSTFVLNKNIWVKPILNLIFDDIKKVVVKLGKTNSVRISVAHMAFVSWF